MRWRGVILTFFIGLVGCDPTMVVSDGGGDPRSDGGRTADAGAGADAGADAGASANDAGVATEGVGTVWTATVDHDHGRPGFLQFSTSLVPLSAPGFARIRVERVGGYQGAVSAELRALSSTGDCAMTAGEHFEATEGVVIAFDDQEAGERYVDIPIITSPGAGLHQFPVILENATGGVELRNPEMQVYFDDGAVNPGATVIEGGGDIAAIVNAGAAGDLFYLRDDAVYSNDVRPSGENVGGYHIRLGGTRAARVVISNYPGETPIIDQGYAQTHDDGGYRVSGGFVVHSSYLTIRGVTIRHVLAVPVSASTETSSVIVENMHLHDIGNPPNGIADYAATNNADNIGAVRLDHSHDAVIRNNLIHDVYDARRDTNRINDVPLGLHSGVHGFYATALWVHNNEIHTVDKGVYSKHPNQEGRPCYRVHENHFHDIGEGAFVVNTAGDGSAGPVEHHYYRNLAVLDRFDTAHPGGAGGIVHQTTSQATQFWVYGNTHVGGAGMSGFENFTEVTVFDNLVHRGGRALSIDGRNGSEASFFAYVDHNLWHDMSDLRFITGRDTDDEIEYTTLAGWRAAYPDDPFVRRPVAAHSLEAAPVFVDEAAGDYRTATGPTEGAGRFGGPIGIGQTVVGPMPGTLDGRR